jgi:hypothetical protein
MKLVEIVLEALVVVWNLLTLLPGWVWFALGVIGYVAFSIRLLNALFEGLYPMLSKQHDELVAIRECLDRIEHGLRSRPS